MLNVLLVNKSQDDLEQLERSLFVQRDKWSLSFASSGREALKVLSQDKIDAIVTSFSVKGTNGAVLLDEVSKDRDGLVGILRADSSENYKALSLKPSKHVIFDRVCEIDTIIKTVDLLVDLKGVLKQPELLNLVDELKKIPNPDLGEEIFIEDLMAQPYAKKIKENILEFSYAAYQATSLKKASFEQIVHVMEPTVLRALALRTIVFEELRECINNEAFLRRVYEHSLAVASFARRLAIEESMPRSVMNEAVVAGLLHNIGNVILAANFKEKFFEIMKRALDENVSYAPLQKKVFGISYADLGAYFLSKWRLKDTIVAATAYHLNPTLSPSKDVGALLAVHVANALVTANHQKAEKYEALFMLNRHYIKAMGLSNRLPIWEQMFTQIV